MPDANNRPPRFESHRGRRADRRVNRRAIAGVALVALWFASLAALSTGHNYCFDAATGRTGIDALDHCATHHPLGLSVVIDDHAVFWSFVLVPAALAVLWWPWRPWRRRAKASRAEREGHAS